VNRLQTNLGKLDLASPLLVASGTFGTEYFDLIDQKLLGAYVTKTITPEAKTGNPPPRLFETEAGLLNSIGLQNPGLESFISDELPKLRSLLSIPLIVSFSASTLGDFCSMLESLEDQEGIAGYEVNVSCPNVEREGIAFGADPAILYKLVKRLSAITKRELTVKLSPNVTDIAAIAQAAVAGGASSLALINTFYGMAIDWRYGESRIPKFVCGYSGSGIKPVALALTYKVAQAVQVPLLAMGGIHTWQDALEFFYAGASAIAIGTATFSDPDTFAAIHQGLDAFLSDKDAILHTLIGTVH